MGIAATLLQIPTDQLVAAVRRVRPDLLEAWDEEREPVKQLLRAHRSSLIVSWTLVGVPQVVTFAAKPEQVHARTGLGSARRLVLVDSGKCFGNRFVQRELAARRDAPLPAFLA